MNRKIDRFDKYIKYKKLNDNKVTVSLGLSVGTLGKSRKEGRDLSQKVIEQILNFYTDINRVWLLTGEGEMLNTSDHPPIEIDPVSGGEINVRQLMNMMQQQMVLVNNVVEQNRQLIDNNGKLVKVNETLAHTNKQLSHTNEKLMKELITLGKEERPAIEDFGSVEDRQ